jgi:hypothetical protein
MGIEFPVSDLNPTPRRAVICGISDYGPSVDRISAVEKDRERLAETLKSHLGKAFRFEHVEVYRDKDLHLTKLESILDSLAQDSRINDGDLFVYIAGHGCVRRGRPYFITFGASHYAPGLRIDDLGEMLRAARAQRTYVLLDFCHSGALPLQLERLRSPIPLTPGPALAILAACRDTEVAVAGSDREHRSHRTSSTG